MFFSIPSLHIFLSDYKFPLPAHEFRVLSPSGDQTTSRFAFPDRIRQALHSVHYSTIDFTPLHTLHSDSKNRELPDLMSATKAPDFRLPHTEAATPDSAC